MLVLEVTADLVTVEEALGQAAHVTKGTFDQDASKTGLNFLENRCDINGHT